MTESTPLYEHDCKACKFLGNLPPYSDKQGRYDTGNLCDVYAHSWSMGLTLIVRSSSEGSDYRSATNKPERWSEVAQKIPSWADAVHLARKAGLVP